MGLLPYRISHCNYCVIEDIPDSMALNTIYVHIYGKSIYMLQWDIIFLATI